MFAGCVLAHIFYTHIPPYSCPHDVTYTRRHGVGLCVLSGCVHLNRPELAKYQHDEACVLTGHRVSESEMTMSFCLVAFLSKLLGL